MANNTRRPMDQFEVGDEVELSEEGLRALKNMDPHLWGEVKGRNQWEDVMVSIAGRKKVLPFKAEFLRLRQRREPC